jgi:hypothetical protein
MRILKQVHHSSEKALSIIVMHLTEEDFGVCIYVEPAGDKVIERQY